MRYILLMSVCLGSMRKLSMTRMSILSRIWAVVVALLLELRKRPGFLMYFLSYRIGDYRGDGIKPVPGQHDQTRSGVAKDH